MKGKLSTFVALCVATTIITAVGRSDSGELFPNTGDGQQPKSAPLLQTPTTTAPTPSATQPSTGEAPTSQPTAPLSTEAPTTQPTAPLSTEAKTAIAKCDTTIDKAEADLKTAEHAALLADFKARADSQTAERTALNTEVTDLTTALDDAMTAKNIDEAVRIKGFIDYVKNRLDSTPQTQTSGVPLSTEAKTAIAKCDFAIRKAEEDLKTAENIYRIAMRKAVADSQTAELAALKTEATGLTAALDDAMTAKNLDEAVRIKDSIDNAKMKIKALSDPTVPTQLNSVASIGSAGTSDKSNKVINLLKLADVATNTVHGSWVLKDGVLTSDSGGSTRLQFAYHPPEEYAFRMDFTRQTGDGDINMILVAGGKQFTWYMGAYKNTILGFGEIRGNRLKDTSTSVKVKSVFENGMRYEAVVIVRKTSVEAYVNGKMISRLKGDYSGMGMPDYWALGDKEALGVGTGGSTIISKAEITEITGQGTIVRDAIGP